MSWRQLAACRGKPIDLFYPDESTLDGRLDAAEAKAICHTCPVAKRCRDWALKKNESGIWGGMTEDERRGRYAVT